MGRKPNPLIVQYFSRGTKVGDSSNRYDHTCKKCGEHFPKGRMEALSAHLTKKCTALTKTERMKILLRFHDLSQKVDANGDPNTAATTEAGHQADGSTGRPNHALLAANEEQDFDALNVLAEASRQVGHNAHNPFDFASLHATQHEDYVAMERSFHAQTTSPQSDANVAAHHAAQTVLDPQLDVHFDDDFLAGPGMLAKNNAFPSAMSTDFTQSYSFMTDGVPITQDGGFGPNMVTTQPQDLAMAVSAAANFDQTIMEMANEDDSTPVDELVADHSPPGQPIPWASFFQTQPLPQQSTTSQASMPNASDAGPSIPGFRPIAINPDPQARQPIMQSKTVNNMLQPRGRARFEPARREEVRAMRKVGACMRCRMLRKNCSSETPCDTCKAVQAPRLWKKKCIRGNVRDIYPLYRVSAYRSALYQESEQMKSFIANDRTDMKIEAFHFDGYKTILTCREMKVKEQVQIPTGVTLPFDAEGLVVIDTETHNNNVPKVERYLKTVTSAIIAREKSPIVKGCLEFAASMAAQQRNVISLNNKTNIISDGVQLWTATAMLTDPELKEKFAVVSGDLQERTEIGSDASGYVYLKLRQQFRAIVEKKAEALCHDVTHYFDQRVFSRGRKTELENFETFLGAVILLNCVERMDWQFRVWENERARPFQWACDNKPEFYADKGATLAEALEMLLGLRSIDAKLAVDTESGLLTPQKVGDTTLGSFLATVQIPHDFSTKHENCVFDPSDYRSLDGGLFGRLLQL